MSRLSRLARDVQSCTNKLELAIAQQDRDQILLTIHGGTGKGAAAAERYAARANQIAGLEAARDGLVTDLRKALDDLTGGQETGKNQSASEPPKRKRRDSDRD